jgi:assimilatory nitrate reductase catalytic subunit
VVCNCYDVSEDEIARELAAARPLGEVQARLKCGTECGSCLPELRRLAAAAGASARAVRP